MPITTRNRLYAHGVTPKVSEKAHASAQIRQLLRLVLDELADVWSYGLCAPLPKGDRQQHYLIKGIQDFSVVPTPVGISGDQAFLRLPSGEVLGLHPLTLGGPTEKATIGSLVDETAELYLLNEIRLRKTTVPVFRGVAGSQPERPDLSESFDTLLNSKQVWATRQDIQLDRVLQYAAEGSRDSLEYFEWNNLYDPSRYVERSAVEGLITQFIEDESSRLLFIAGESGAGKTATSMHLAHHLLDKEVPVCVIRAVEMPSRVGGGEHRLEAWFCALHGYAGTFGEILERAALVGKAGRFVIIIDGLNEFLAAGRDLDGLWRAINGLVEAHTSYKSLKVILTTRVEAETLNIYFPHNHVPEFANHGLFHLVDGKPWMVMPGLTPEETGAMLRTYGMDPQTAATAQQLHGLKLAKPNLLSRYAEGVLSGDDLKEIGKDGITKRFVRRRVAKDKDLQKNLDRLVATLGKNKALEMTLDQIAKHDSGLATALTARNNRLLYRMKELGLASFLRTEDNEGRPTTSVSFGDDTVFEALWFQRRIRFLRRGLLLVSALLALLFLLLILFAMALPRTGVIPQLIAECHKTLGAGIDRLRIAHPDAASQTAIDQLHAKALTLLGEAGALVTGFFSAACWFMLANGLFFAGSVLAPCLAGFALQTWLEQRRRGDFRIRYFAECEMQHVLKKVSVPALLAAVAAVVWAAAIAWVRLQEGPNDRPSVVVMHAPIAVVLLLCTLLGLPATMRAFRKAAERSPSVLLRSLWFSRPEVIHDVRRALLLCFPFAVSLSVVVVSIVCMPSPKDLWLGHDLEDRAAQMQALAPRFRALEDDVAAITGDRRETQDVALNLDLSFLARPMLSQEERTACAGGLAGIGGLFLISAGWAFAIQIRTSKRLFPEQWGGIPHRRSN